MELRKDYILDRWVFFASERKARPREFRHEETAEGHECFFCPGNEALTPGEIGRVGSRDKWQIRWFPNKFPAVIQEGNPHVRTDNTFYTFSSAYGRHEIIVDTPDHGKQLWDLPKEHVAELLKVYFGRIAELEKVPDVSHVSVFKNHGREAGTSLVHSHSQVAAISIAPRLIREEVSASRNFSSCPYCSIIDSEKRSFRRCFENGSIVAFTPYASRFNYEIWIFPKRHISGFQELSEAETGELSDILRHVLARLRSVNAPYNFFLHYSSRESLHPHIEVTPRMATWAGFEISTDAIINSVTPEDAAAFYRGEL
ncbi:DUF4931 domain-containing protein [Candidatus Woesearchaeota archaeon]|nr:DUF4931 domain-containing protein [Candidatus Woesearchaeota archaeon]